MIAEDRKITGPLTWRSWEHLVHAMAEMDRRQGNPPMDLGTAMGWGLTLIIPELIERLRLEQEMKLDVIPTWPPAQATEGTQA